MKKLLSIAVPAVLFFVLISTSKAAPGGVALAQFDSDTRLALELQSVDWDVLARIVLLPEEDFDSIEAAGIIQRLTKLPDALLSKINESGIVIRLFEGSLTDNPTASHLKGKTPRGYTNGATWDSVPGIGGSEVVLVKIGASEKGKGHGSVNLELHELAHSVDNLVYGGLTERDEFQLIWREERAKLFPDQQYFIEYPEEYFAEAFAFFYFSEDSSRKLKESAPLTYKMIQDLE